MLTKCWIWQYAKSTAGYGQIRRNGKAIYLHRLIYEAFNGKIKKGLTIDHLCRQRSCFNPDHLEAVSNRENILRGNGASAINFRKTKCINGHLLVEKNIYHRHQNPTFRYCRECIKVWRKRSRRKERITIDG